MKMIRRTLAIWARYRTPRSFNIRVLRNQLAFWFMSFPCWLCYRESRANKSQKRSIPRIANQFASSLVCLKIFLFILEWSADRVQRSARKCWSLDVHNHGLVYRWQEKSGQHAKDRDDQRQFNQHKSQEAVLCHGPLCSLCIHFSRLNHSGSVAHERRNVLKSVIYVLKFVKPPVSSGHGSCVPRSASR